MCEDTRDEASSLAGEPVDPGGVVEEVPAAVLRPEREVDVTAVAGCLRPRLSIGTRSRLSFPQDCQAICWNAGTDAAYT